MKGSALELSLGAGGIRDSEHNVVYDSLERLQPSLKDLFWDLE